MSPEKLMKKVAEKDKSALEKLYLDYRGPVFAVALSVMKNKQDAEDITEDTFVNLISAAKNYRGGSVKCYLVTISRNLAINKRSKHLREVFTDFTENESLFGEYSYRQDFADNIALKTALDTLPDLDRQIVFMHNAGLKHREIAEVMRVPLGTITWKYQKALETLRTLLSEN